MNDDEDLIGYALLLDGASQLTKESGALDAKWRAKNLQSAAEMVNAVRIGLLRRSGSPPSEKLVSTMMQRVHDLAAEIRTAGGPEIADAGG